MSATQGGAGPVLVVAGVLVRQGRVLLTQRVAGTHLAGAWEFPGGKMEPGESPEAALVRELREEVGLAVTVGEVLEVTFWRYPKKDVLLLFYRVEAGDAPVQNLQVAAHAWVDADGLAAYTFPPADEAVLVKVRRLLRGEGAAEA